MSDTTFLEIQAQLVAEWQSKFDEAQSDQERGEVMQMFVLERERIRTNVTEAGPRRNEVDRKTLERLSDPTVLGPEFSQVEGIFRRLASDPTSAVVYQRTAAEQRSKAQSDRASKGRPRRKDCITVDIEEIVAVDLSICAKEVGEKLRNDYDITLNDGEYRHNIDASTLKESNLASRVSDAKKRLLKSFSG